MLMQSYRQRFEMREHHNCRCLVVEVPDVQKKMGMLSRMLANFPHPRNEPGQAVDALHQARQLRDEIEQCHKEQADHAANPDVQK